jgi:type II secretory pathway pseudopilin PulG
VTGLANVNKYKKAQKELEALRQSAQEELKTLGWVRRSGGDPYDSNSCWTIWVDPSYAHLISGDEYEIPDEIPDGGWVSL